MAGPTQTRTTFHPIINDENFSVIVGGTAQDCFDSIDVALLNARSTGIRYGGELSEISPGIVRIQPGEGQILDNADPENPTFYPVVWEETDIDLSGAADGVQNFIYADETGTVSYTTTDPSHAEYRTAIWLHRVVIRSGAVTGAQSIVRPVQQYGPEIWDIWDALGLLTHDTDFILSSDGSGGMDIGAGGVYAPGANFYTDPKSPNEISFAAQNSPAFRIALRTNVQTGDVTVFDVTNYDVAGTVTAMTNNHWGIYEIYMFPNGNIRCLRPQDQYTTFTSANQTLYLGQYQPVRPDNFSDALRLGWLIFKKGDTTLTTANFITANKFGGIGGAIATIGTGYASVDGDNDFTGANIFTNASFSLTNLPTYATNAAAVSGGLAVNRVYKTATGELRIVV